MLYFRVFLLAHGGGIENFSPTWIPQGWNEILFKSTQHTALFPTGLSGHFK